MLALRHLPEYQALVSRAACCSASALRVQPRRSRRRAEQAAEQHVILGVHHGVAVEVGLVVSGGNARLTQLLTEQHIVLGVRDGVVVNIPIAAVAIAVTVRVALVSPCRGSCSMDSQFAVFSTNRSPGQEPYPSSAAAITIHCRAPSLEGQSADPRSGGGEDRGLCTALASLRRTPHCDGPAGVS